MIRDIRTKSKKQKGYYETFVTCTNCRKKIIIECMLGVKFDFFDIHECPCPHCQCKFDAVQYD